LIGLLILTIGHITHFLISALSESLQVWRASAEKITFVSSEGVEGGAEVFNNYGDKTLGESGDPWVGGCHGICSWDFSGI
jgi:hypothetical protein